MINSICMHGKLCADSEFKNGDVPYCRFRIAHNAGRDKTVFISCVAFRNCAEWCSKFKKGDAITVQGKLESSENDGKTYYSIIVDSISGWPKDSGKSTKNDDDPFGD